jgi:hypothetical protein
MQKILITFMLVLVSVTSNASSKWILIDKSANATFFVDLNSLQKSGDSVTFWRRANYSQRDQYGNLSSKNQITINCRTRERISRYFMTYDDINNEGKLTNSFAVGTDEKWEPIAPDSINWGFFEVVCKK